MKNIHFLIPTLAIVASACAPGIKASAPAGKLGGQDWNFGKAVVTKSDKLSITMYADPTVDDCTTTASSKNTVFWSMPAATGERKLKLSFTDLNGSQTVTYYDGTTNYILSEGLIDVVTLTDTLATIGLVASDTNNNEINGTFTAAICP
jgi:hypothetical protein